MADLLGQLKASLQDVYDIERELGGGGMSRVFVATERRLNRRVVIKVLSPELAAGVSSDRFEREIQLAASVLQANIVPVLSTGEAAELPYYTMPYIEGESLRARLARDGTIPAEEVVAILRDVARALAYAHERGIVHRDIKPDNVLLSGGAAVVTDFGIAKAISAARQEARESGTAALTMMGTSIGTPSYMAPEQAAGDPDVDHRADIYALGCMAYELLAGHPPFHGRTPQRVLAAHMGEPAPPLADVAPLTPPVLAALVMRCLAKEPGDRPQKAGEIVRALDAAATGVSQETLSASLLARPGLLKWALAIYAVAFVIVAVVAKAAIVGVGLPDWVLPGSMVVMGLGLPVLLFTGYAQSVVRRLATTTPTLTPGGRHATHGTMATIAMRASPHLTWRRSALGGAIAIGIFVLMVGGFMGMRAAGIGPFGTLLASGELEDPRLLLGDFTATSTDSTLGAVVAEAVRADLSQSSAITLVSPQVVSAALQRMQRPLTTRLDSAVAREVAIREGIPAFVTGDIHGLGAGFIVNLRLVSADSGRVLASFSEAANTPADLIPSIGKLSRQLRSRIGESLKDLQATPRLADAMTTSLPALRKYTAASGALRRSELADAQRLFEEAFALDTTFADAYRGAAVALGNSRLNPELELRYARRAFDLADRQGPLDRHRTRGYYYSRVDPDRAIEEYEAALRLQPSHAASLNNLSLLEMRRRDFAAAERYLSAAIVADSTSSVNLSNLGWTQLARGRVTAAESTLRRLEQRHPGNPLASALRTSTLLARREVDSAVTEMEAVVGRTENNPGVVGMAGRSLWNAYLVQGRLRQAKSFGRDLASQLRAARVPGIDVSIAASNATAEGWYGGDRAAALRMLDSVLRIHPLDSLAPMNRPYIAVGMAYAALGAHARARAMFDAAKRVPGVAMDLFSQQALRSGAALIAHAEGRYADGIREARAADVGACVECALPLLAQNYDMAGQPDSAIAIFTRYLNSHGDYGDRSAVDAMFLTGSHKRLGELLEERGDRAGALQQYEMVLRLWRRADPLLQPQVQEVRRRAERLRAAGG